MSPSLPPGRCSVQRFQQAADGSVRNETDANCLTNLVAALDACNEGDLTVEVVPVTKPIDGHSEDATVQELVDLFNGMLAKAQRALAG